MTNKQDIFDMTTIEALTMPLEELEQLLRESGADPVREASLVQTTIRSAVDAHRDQMLANLPDEVPKDTASVDALLDRLMSFPGVPKETYAIAFREKTKLSTEDKRLIADNLIELLKRRG